MKRTKNNTGCPLCKCSRGEKFIAKWLKHEGIEFNTQFMFEDCRNVFRLPFDFYIPKLNVCIEYHGEQHYKPVPYFGGTSRFEKNKIRDKIKEKYCMDNNIRLLIIPYWKFSGARNILKEFIYD